MLYIWSSRHPVTVATEGLVWDSLRLKAGTVLVDVQGSSMFYNRQLVGG